MLGEIKISNPKFLIPEELNLKGISIGIEVTFPLGNFVPVIFKAYSIIDSRYSYLV